MGEFFTIRVSFSAYRIEEHFLWALNLSSKSQKETTIFF